MSGAESRSATGMSPHPPRGLYDPSMDHDACGTGFVARIDGERSHRIVQLAVEAVVNLTHRGAVSADAASGDGAGVTLQIPFELLREDAERLGHVLERRDELAVAMVFLPQDEADKTEARAIIEQAVEGCGVQLIGWRETPHDPSVLGGLALESLPGIEQLLLRRPPGLGGADCERALYLARRQAEAAFRERSIDCYVVSMSSKVVVYKGLMVAPQLAAFYPDLSDERTVAAVALFHQRFATNTLPNWKLAQPFRLVAHNGEINTLLGNRNWMSAREPELTSAVWGDQIEDLLPVIWPIGSDTASLDEALELLTASGRNILHAMMMLIPEAWENMPNMDPQLRAFYEYHACLQEPWDGPAAVAFTNGTVAAAIMDRNGLRPARYQIMRDGTVVMGSEVGLVDLPFDEIVESGRLGPGEMIAVDTARRQFLHNDQIKREISSRRPYGDWVRRNLHSLSRYLDSANGQHREQPDGEMRARQTLHGYTREEIEYVIKPMVREGKEPVGSMGEDTPLSTLFDPSRLLYTYFKQKFAQVTNPAIDSIREEIVMSLDTLLGRRHSLLETTPEAARLVHLNSPLMVDEEMAALRNTPIGTFALTTLHARFAASEGPAGLRSALDDLCAAAELAVDEGHDVIVISDRLCDGDWAPIPMLLAVSSVHHHLIRTGRRMKTSLVAEAGDARDVHHFACLIGFGASAVNPYLAFDTLRDLTSEGEFGEVELDQVMRQYQQAVDARDPEGDVQDGHLRRLLLPRRADLRGAGYLRRGHRSLVPRHHLAHRRYRLRGHRARYPGPPRARLPGCGDAARRLVQVPPRRRLPRLRAEGLARAAQGGAGRRRPGGVPGVQRPGARAPAHGAARRPRLPVRPRPDRCLARRADRPGDATLQHGRHVARRAQPRGPRGHRARDEHPRWPLQHRRRRRGPAALQPGRRHARRQLQGQAGGVRALRRDARLPRLGGGAGDQDRAGLEARRGRAACPATRSPTTSPRCATSWRGPPLISPPPHHDIYSIEDLAQLIIDLKAVNPRARVCVKLVAAEGVGTIAAGVAKGFADIIQISGHDGGTGASPWSSIKYAGRALELGLAETQQVLVANALRGRVRLRADGGFHTGRDVLVAAMLGAEEYGFGTSAMIAVGCKMARQCHINTCPVGVATQREDLRAKYFGKPEMVIKYLTHVGEEVRAILAELGYERIDDIIGRPELLKQLPPEGGRGDGIDLANVLMPADPTGLEPRHSIQERNDRGEALLDDRIIADVRSAIVGGPPVQRSYEIRNTDRTVGARLSGEIALRYGNTGLPEGSIELAFRGSAGQSFGAFLSSGMRLHLVGEANDYVAKGMNGGEITVRPPEDAGFLGADTEAVLIGNTVLYGATGGHLFVAGSAGERFAVRNSGARAVVEGIGDHGCEYMTDGVIVILGRTGRNFGAGMSDGIAYVLDEEGDFRTRVNQELVGLEQVTTPDAINLLEMLVRRHLEMTGSPRARHVLNEWRQYLPKFWKVVPRFALTEEGPMTVVRRHLAGLRAQTAV